MRDFVEAECLVPVNEGTHIELRPLKDNEGRRSAGGNDMASMDSTDTFASCNTHPFNSLADLTREDSTESQNGATHRVGDKDPTLYVNPLEDTTSTDNPLKAPITPRSSPRHRPKPLAYTTDVFDDTKSTDNLLGNSRTSLQDSPLPKHRRARFQEGAAPRPFSRLLESVERARADRNTKEPAEKNRQTAIARAGRNGSKSSLGEGEPRPPPSPEKKKSILKHRDPESEQLLPDLREERPKKPRALPVKFVGLDDKDDGCTRPRRVLPRSPMPFSGRHGMAPLADFLAEFGGQEKAARDELSPENFQKDSLEPPFLDRKTVNTVYKCSRPSCTINKPIITPSTDTGDTAISNRSQMKCICGAVMSSMKATTPTNHLLPIPPPTIVTSSVMGDISQPSVRRDSSENRLHRSDELNNGPTPVREVEDLLFADQNSPSEETRLLGGAASAQKGTRLSS